MKNNKKHILVVSQYFYPENFRVNDLASEWVSRGYNVTVLTGIPNYPAGKFFDGYSLFKKRKENYNGVNIIRIPLIPRGKSKLKLLLNYLSFVISGYLWKMFTKLKPDYVFIYEVSPMTQALPALSFAKKMKIPCYLYVTDLWPESVEVVIGLKNKYVLSVLNKMVDSIYHGCDKILTSSQSFVTKISSRDDSYANKLMFWPQYAESFYSKPSSRCLNTYDKYFMGDESFKIIFAGNIGEAQGLNIVVDVAVKLKKLSKNVTFYFIGDGRYKDKLINLISKNDVDTYFRFIDSQNPVMIKHFMFEGDAALISLSKSDIFSMTIPGKTQSCLACGIPILVAADGEVQSIVENAKAGLCSESGDSEGLFININTMLSMKDSDLEIMANNAINYSKVYFSKDGLMEKVDELFKTV